jgi:MFS family permease
MIYAGRVISGFGIGGMSAVAPAYVSECSPKEVRGRITGTAQVMARTFFLLFAGTDGTDRSKQVATGGMISYFINCKTAPPAQRSSPFISCFHIDGISLNTKLKNNPKVWRIPFGFQLVPAGIMLFGLLTVKVSLSTTFLNIKSFLNYISGISSLARLCR